MVDAHALEADVDALDDALRREIEVRGVVAAELGAQDVGVPRHAFQRHAKQDLGHAAAVERRRVDEGHAAVEGDADGLHGLVDIDAAEFRPERRGAEAQDGQLQVRLPQFPLLHRRTSFNTKTRETQRKNPFCVLVPLCFVTFGRP